MSIKKGMVQIEEQAIEIKANTTAIKDDTCKVRADTAMVKNKACEIKLDTTAIKDDTTEIRADAAVIRNDACEIKTSNAVIRSDVCEVKADTAAIRNDSSEIKGNTEQINKKLDHFAESDLKAKILEWITPISYAHKLNDVLSKRQTGTGQWFLEADAFETWVQKDSGSNVLYCQGAPGAGKTVLSSIIIKHLQSIYPRHGDVAVAYLFCDYLDKDVTVQSMILSLLKQLLEEHRGLPKAIKDVYDKHKDGKNRARPTLDDFLCCISAVVDDRDFSAVYVVVDALDEFRNEDRPRQDLIEKLLNIQEKSANTFKILVTARPLPNIEALFRNSLSLEISATKGDIRLYLENNVKGAFNITQDVKANNAFQEEIITGISTACDGMYKPNNSPK